MKTVRAIVAGIVTLLLLWSAGASAPTAAAATDPVTFTTGCGFVELTSQSADPLLVLYGDPRRVKEDGHFTLAPSAMKHIRTTRTQFAFVAVAMSGEPYFSPVITEQNCPKVTAKTPKITGKTRVGELLTATTVGWAPVDVQLSYQWYRSGKKITDATTSTYMLTKSDKGKKISVKVTGAHDGYFSASKTSKATSKVKAGVLVAVQPTIAGSAIVGTELTAIPGAWGPAGVSLSYQWYRSGKKISRATQPVYKPVPSDFGKKLGVKVTGKLAGYTTVTKTSAPTVKVTVTA